MISLYCSKYFGISISFRNTGYKNVFNLESHFNGGYRMLTIFYGYMSDALVSGNGVFDNWFDVDKF